MKRTLKYLVLFVVVFSVAFIGCKKKVQPGLSEINKECDCAEEVSADFTIEELAFNTSPNFLQYRTETDTIWENKNVRFYAKQEAVGYKWIIGNDTVENRLVYRNFNSSWGGQRITIKLISYKKPNKICFPNETGHDTVVKSFYVQTYAAEGFIDCLSPLPRFEGTFRLLKEGTTDSVDVFMGICEQIPGLSPPMSFDNYMTILNPNENGAQYNYGNIVETTYKQIWRDNTGASNGSNFMSISNDHGIISLVYPQSIIGVPILAPRTYKGRKL